MRQFLKDLNVDWIGKSKYFVVGSLALLLAGGAAMWQDGGPLWGVDFKGGTLVYVRFAQEPPIDQIRQGLSQQNLGDANVQAINDINNPGAHEVVIRIEQQGQGEQALDAGKQRILAALNTTFPAPQTGKPDINNTGSAAIAETLTRRDPLGLGPTSAARYEELAKAITGFRDRQRGGLLTNLDELTQAPEVTAAVSGALKDAYSTGAFAVRNVEIVGPTVGAQLRAQAFWATIYALIGMLVYIALRFEWIYGTAAVIAVFHDVLVTLGFMAIFNYEISLTVIAALLTLVGYSMNDTIVIFDRMRENLRTMRREPLYVIANRSINQTLSRTFLTAGLTFLTVLVLFLMGGEVLRSFSFALLVGVMIGTYSTVGIAAAIVVAWDKFRGGRGLSGATVSVPSRQAGPADKRVAAAGRR